MNGSLQVDEFKIIVDIMEHPPIMQTRLLHLQLYRTHKASIITIIIHTLILILQNSLRQTKDQLQDINNLYDSHSHQDIPDHLLLLEPVLYLTYKDVQRYK
jgi:hypothetical protein